MKMTLVDMGMPEDVAGSTRADEPSRRGRTLTIQNEAGIVTAKVYVLGDGNLHADSWIKTGDVI